MAVARDREHSVVASLAELRMIEEQRVADERAALRDAEAARVAATVRAEQTRVAERAGHDQAERAHVLAVETARVTAEREARIRVECAAMAERDRLAHARDTHREACEHALARETALRQRPTWMVAVTVIATLAAGVMVYVGLERRAESHASDARRVLAEAETSVAKEARAAAIAQLDDTQARLAQLSSRVAAAEAQLAISNTAADREAAQAALAHQRAALAAERARLDKLRADRERAERLGGVDVTDCVGTSLCAKVK